MAATAIDNAAELSIALGISVRLDVRRRELEAYLRGILFALGEEPA
jgi:hypothetical protein